MEDLIRREEKGYYFESYSELESQQAMIRDYTRTVAYRRAIEMNPHLFKDKVVLDVGCGLGILSLFAAKAGAKLVIGVDASDVCDLAERIVKDNKFDSVIKIVNSKIEDLTELPLGIEKVDIIISEWMGLCLYHESMLSTVLYARDKWLKADGLMFPDKVRLYLAAIDDLEVINKVERWNCVAGFSMETLKDRLYHEATATSVEPNKVITSYCLINELNLYKAKPDFSFTKNYSLIAEREGHVTGFCTYFDAIFSKCHKKITLSTSPSAPQTHWGQTVFRFRESMWVNRDNEIKGTFSLMPFEHNFRDLSFRITVHLVTTNMEHQFTCSYVLR